MDRVKNERILRLPEKSRINESICDHLDFLLDFASAEEYRDTLIELYHLYLIHEHVALPDEFDRIANQMYLLVTFMKEVALEIAANPPADPPSPPA